MGGDVALLASEMTPYISAAVAAYGTAVLTKMQDEAADATVGLGRRLLQRVFGSRSEGDQLPGPLADLAAYPQDNDALAAVRLEVRKTLAVDQVLETEVRSILAEAQVTVTASGDRSIAAQVISGTAVTGDYAQIGGDQQSRKSRS
jgi:hypothetical protein